MIAMVARVNVEQRKRVSGLLHGAVNGISGMLSRSQTHWKTGKGIRPLTCEEISSLRAAHVKVLQAIDTMEADTKKDDADIEEVCGSENAVAHFHSRHLYKVTDLNDIDVGIFHCLMRQCEEKGIVDQLHLYLFAANE